MNRFRALHVAMPLTLAILVAHDSAAASPAALDTTRLSVAIHGLAARVRPAMLGVGVRVLGSDDGWFWNGDRPMPMQSVFKAPLAAAVLDAADHGTIALDSTIELARTDLSPMYSPVRDSFPARRAWTLDELLVRAVETSDNTAADVLLAKIGGPAALATWLRARGIDGISVDRFEREQQPEILGLGRFQLAWTDPDSLDRARHAVPAALQREARDAYLYGRQDTMTPRGAIAFLDALAAGRLISAGSTARLLELMTAVVTGPNRLHAGLPRDARLAHKTGTGPLVLGVSTATNDIGIATLADGRRVAIVALLSASSAGEAARDATLASVARAVVAALR